MNIAIHMSAMQISAAHMFMAVCARPQGMAEASVFHNDASALHICLQHISLQCRFLQAQCNQPSIACADLQRMAEASVFHSNAHICIAYVCKACVYNACVCRCNARDHA